MSVSGDECKTSCSVSGASVSLQKLCKLIIPLIIQVEDEDSTLGRHSMRRSALTVENRRGLLVPGRATAPAYSGARSEGNTSQ